MAGARGFEPRTFGFGIHCATSCAIPPKFFSEKPKCASQHSTGLICNWTFARMDYPDLSAGIHIELGSNLHGTYRGYTRSHGTHGVL